MISIVTSTSTASVFHKFFFPEYTIRALFLLLKLEQDGGALLLKLEQDGGPLCQKKDLSFYTLSFLKTPELGISSQDSRIGELVGLFAAE